MVWQHHSVVLCIYITSETSSVSLPRIDLISIIITVFHHFVSSNQRRTLKFFSGVLNIPTS